MPRPKGRRRRNGGHQSNRLRGSWERAHCRVVSVDRLSPILIAAPHGGQTEPHTAKIAKAIAATTHSLYVLEARAPHLHLTSHLFNEPCAISQAARHSTVLTIHGCNDRRSRSVDIFVGGLDVILRDVAIAELRRIGFGAAVDRWTPGTAPENICNRGSSRAGVQLEISRRLRNRLSAAANSRLLSSFAHGVQKAIEHARAQATQTVRELARSR